MRKLKIALPPDSAKGLSTLWNPPPYYERKNIMKKIIAFTAALVMLAGAVSCGKKKSSSDTDEAKNNSVSYMSYNAADIEMGNDFSDIRALTSDPKSGDILIFGQTKNNGWHGYVTTGEFSDRTEFRFSPAENETVVHAAMLGFGKKGILTCMDGKTFIHIINADGNEEKLLDCGEILTPFEDGSIYGRLCKNGDGYAVSDSEYKLHFIGGDGSSLGEPDLKGMAVMGVSGNSDGGVTLILRKADNSLCMADSDGTELINQRDCTGSSSSAIAVCTGFGDCEFAGVFVDGLYTLKDGSWTKLSDFAALDFHTIDISELVMTGDNKFAAVTKGSALYMLSEEDISALKSKKIVSLAVYQGRADQYVRLADDYNKAHPDSEYRIEVQQYIVDDTISYDQMMDNMKMDIITGDAPDIIVDHIDGLDPAVYYVDLMEYLKDDPDLNADDFIPGYIDAVTIDGSVPTIFPSFWANTLIGKTRFTGEKENWNYDDFIAAYEAMPEGMELKNNLNGTMTDSLFFLINIQEFVNYNNGTCDFKSPEFTKMMQFVKDNHIGLTQQEWDDLYSGQTLIFWETNNLCYRENKTLLGEGFLQPVDIAEKLHAVFDEEVSFVGFPTLNGTGGYISNPDMSFSIMKTSEYPDIAWDFIKSAFADEQYDTYKHLGFPTLEDKFVEKFDECMNVYHYEGDDYETKIPQGEWYYDNENQKYILYDPLNEEECDRAMEYIRSCVKNFRRYDQDLEKIVREELDEYFNSDKSAEDTAAMIQNRASIYLSENYG